MTKQAKQLVILLGVFLLLSASVVQISHLGTKTRTAFYSEQVAASEKMALCIEHIRKYKSELGLTISEYDRFETGMIGEEFNEITTTLGAIEAKRTSANADMAALVVRMFHQIGLKKGDHVAAGFSGSFPSLNLAVLCACDAMELRITPITSVGASTFGANQPSLTFPDMLHRLCTDNVLTVDSAAVTPGGDIDCGSNMGETVLSEIVTRFQNYGLEIIIEPSLPRNIEQRIKLYESNGKVDCFVAVGGNVTFLGTSETASTLGQGVLLPDVTPIGRIDDSSGLIQHYLSENVPVVHLLNVKKFISNYGMAFDPMILPQAGESPVYYIVEYPKLPMIIVCTAAFLLLRHMGMGGGRHSKTEN